MKKLMALAIVFALLLTSAVALAEGYTIGHYGGWTGAVATAGSNGRDAILLAVKQWNEKGGVLGGEIKVELYDDGGTTEGATKGVSYLLDQVGVDGLIGSQLSGNIQATGDTVEAYQVPEVATGMNPAWLQKGWTYLFRSLPNSQGGAAPLVDAMVELKSDKIASLFTMSDDVKFGWTVIGAVAGSMWDKDFPMTKISASEWKSDEAFEMEAGTEFKVRQGLSWDNNFPADNFKVEEAGTYYVVFNETTGEVSLSAE